MNMESLGAPSEKRRRSEELMVGDSMLSATEDTEAVNPQPTTNNQEPPLPPLLDVGGEDEGDGSYDRISSLPEAILGNIISLDSTKEAARTQTLASQWRHIWRRTPLILNESDLATMHLGFQVDENVLAAADEALANKVSLILSTHPGRVHRFCIPPHHLHNRAATVNTWLLSSALDNLQELDLWDDGKNWYVRPFVFASLPASTFRFSTTLCVATLTKCQLLDSLVEGLRFPHLKKLGLEYVSISEASLNTMISSCPVLECFLLNHSFGFSCVRIISGSLRSICMGASNWGNNNPQLQEFIIVNAPCLERLLFLQQCMSINVSVITAPKLETLGCLCDGPDPFRLKFGTTAIEGVQVVNQMTVVCNVRILAVKSWHINLDKVIDLMKCFPCLEKLYIKCGISGEMNRWRRKHKQFIKCFDIRLKTIVLEGYRGTRSQVNFASFFLLNASKLELMTLEIGNRSDNEAFIAEQYEVLQMERRASRTSRLHFKTDRCCQDVHVNHVRDLAITNPFECRC